jgi:hypothetical protein
VVYDGEIARRLEDVFVADLEQSREVTYQQWADRGFFSRFLELLSIPVRGQL